MTRGDRRFVCWLVAALSVGRPVLAQSTRAARDSAARDSVVRDSLARDSTRYRPIHDPRMYLLLPVGFAGMVVATVVATVAPAPAARWLGKPGPPTMAAVKDHRFVYVAVGGAYDKLRTRTLAAGMEVVRQGMYAELRVEDFYRPRRFEYITVRGGYLFHPRNKSAGGVTVGYQHASSDPAQRGVEVGLPLLLGDSTGTVRIDPTYLLSSGGVLWNYRVQLEFPIPRQPYFLGVSGVVKSVPFGDHHRRQEYPEKGIFTGAVTLHLGVRF